MRVFTHYLIFLTVLECLLNVVLASTGVGDIDIYIISNILVYLIVTLVFTRLRPSARQPLAIYGIVLFFILVLVTTLKVLETVQV